MAQEDYEQLENDQLLVQAMMGSRFLRTFERAVNEWNSSLSVVGDVVQALVVVR
jgi:dynein heavy chain